MSTRTYNGLSRADLHIHTSYSDGLLEPEDAVNFAVTAEHRGLRVIAITDHNTIDGALHAHEYWQSQREVFNNIEVIIGEEISSEDGHILGLFLKEPVPPRMSAADTVKAIHEQGAIAIAAHPFTHLLIGSDMKGVGRQLADLPFDAIETRNSTPIELYTNWMTAAYNARTRQHTTVGGSDCHYLPMLGQTYTWFAGHTADDLRTSLLEGRARAGGSICGPSLTLQFVWDELRRRRLPRIRTDDHHYRRAGNGLTIDVEELRHSPGAVLHGHGRILRGQSADLLKAQGYALLDGGVNWLVMDLSEVNFIDSAGLGALVAIQKRARQAGGDVALAGPSKDIQTSIRLVRLDRVFPIHDHTEAAVAAFNFPAEARRAS